MSILKPYGVLRGIDRFFFSLPFLLEEGWGGGGTGELVLCFVHSITPKGKALKVVERLLIIG